MRTPHRTFVMVLWHCNWHKRYKWNRHIDKLFKYVDLKSGSDIEKNQQWQAFYWLQLDKRLIFVRIFNQKAHTRYTRNISSTYPYDAKHTFTTVGSLIRSIYDCTCSSFKLRWAFFSSTFSLHAENRHACTQARQHYVTSYRNQKAFHILSSWDTFVSYACRRSPEEFSLLLTFIHVVGCSYSYSSYLIFSNLPVLFQL